MSTSEAPEPQAEPDADPGAGAASGDRALLHPLLADDPPSVGGRWLDARVAASPSGVAFTAHDDHNTPALLVMLSEGASADAAAVDRFAGTVNKMHIDTVLARGGRGQGEGRLGHTFAPGPATPAAPDERPNAPWVALAFDGSSRAVDEAERVLAEVDLSWLPQQGRPAGPDYRLPWIDKVAPGLSRPWPLPWPGRGDRAGWGTLLLSWLIMMLLMALAILVAILLFQAAPPQSPPPPVPTESTESPPPSPDSASPSPDTASPSPDSASPSPDSASPSPQSGSPEPSPSGSPGGSPSPNSRL
ncbi:hypothetical protein PCC79_07005 [Propioniciclava soli]|uniref:Uncharacterized protein n=2 Tax=Propioniciclava soli TaxID=2775081 RepID=A0ABZ3CBM6_9ACTN|nr:hypothetical protein [Propioniciclava soli]